MPFVKFDWYNHSGVISTEESVDKDSMTTEMDLFEYQSSPPNCLDMHKLLSLTELQFLHILTTDDEGYFSVL